MSAEYVNTEEVKTSLPINLNRKEAIEMSKGFFGGDFFSIIILIFILMLLFNGGF